MWWIPGSPEPQSSWNTIEHLPPFLNWAKGMLGRGIRFEHYSLVRKYWFLFLFYFWVDICHPILFFSWKRDTLRTVLWKVQGKFFHKKKINFFGLKTSLEINVHLIRNSVSKGNDVEFWFVRVFIYLCGYCGDPSFSEREVYMSALPACTKGSTTLLSSIKMIQLSAKRQSRACSKQALLPLTEPCCPGPVPYRVGNSSSILAVCLENKVFLGEKGSTAVSSQIAPAMSHILLALQRAPWTHPCGCCFHVHSLQHLSTGNNSSFDSCTEFHRMMFMVAWFWFFGFRCWLGVLRFFGCLFGGLVLFWGVFWFFSFKRYARKKYKNKYKKKAEVDVNTSSSEKQLSFGKMSNTKQFSQGDPTFWETFW